MTEREAFYPKEENLGQKCQFWCIGGLATGCCFTKAELEGRRSCEGVVDDVCLFVQNGRRPSSLTEDQMMEIQLTIPRLDGKNYLPPGDY